MIEPFRRSCGCYLCPICDWSSVDMQGDIKAGTHSWYRCAYETDLRPHGPHERYRLAAEPEHLVLALEHIAVVHPWTRSRLKRLIWRVLQTFAVWLERVASKARGRYS